MRKRLLTDDQIAKIAEQMKAGKPIDLICLNWKVNIQLLRISMRRAGYAELVKPTAPNSKRLTLVLVEKAKAFMADGFSQREAARRIGFSSQSLNARLTGRTRGARDLPPKPKERPLEVVNSRLENHISFNNACLSTLQLRVSL